MGGGSEREVPVSETENGSRPLEVEHGLRLSSGEESLARNYICHVESALFPLFWQTVVFSCAG